MLLTSGQHSMLGAVCGAQRAAVAQSGLASNRKVARSNPWHPPGCMSKHLWARFWTPKCSWWASWQLARQPQPSVYECVNVTSVVKLSVGMKVRLLDHFFPQTGSYQDCWSLLKHRYHVIPTLLYHWLTNLVRICQNCQNSWNIHHHQIILDPTNCNLSTNSVDVFFFKKRFGNIKILSIWTLEQKETYNQLVLYLTTARGFHHFT